MPGGIPIFEGTLCKTFKNPLCSSLLTQDSLRFAPLPKDHISIYMIYQKSRICYLMNPFS